jgi:transcriptional regulator with XRE-family HTH domain
MTTKTISRITNLSTDDAILSEIGTRLARRRLDMGLTQAQVAEQAGIAKRTLERIEAGASAQMSNMIRILRVLDLVGGLDRMIPSEPPRPIDLLRRKGKVRQRASARRPDKPGKPWSWQDEP